MLRKNRNKMRLNFYKKQYQTQLKLMITKKKNNRITKLIKNNSLRKKLNALKMLKIIVRFLKNSKHFS